MAATTKDIIIVGATGLIGKHITNAILHSKDKFGKITVFTSEDTVQRKSDEIEDLRNRGANIVTGDVTSDANINEVFSGHDTVVSCLGRPVIDRQLRLIELADKHADIKRFFPSEYGTDIEYWPSSANERPHQQKLRVRALLKTVKDLEYTYVVTGPYGDADGGLYLSAKKDNEAEGTFDVKRKRAVLLGNGNGRISLTTMRDVGKLVVAALLHPEHIKNKAIKVNSFTTSPRMIVAEFEKQTGDSWDVQYTSIDKLKQLESEAWERGEPRAGGITLRRIWTEGGTLYDRRDNDLIRMEDKVDTLEDAVRQAIDVQMQQAS